MTVKLTNKVSALVNHFLYSASIGAGVDVSWTLRQLRSLRLGILLITDDIVGRCQLENNFGHGQTMDIK